MLYVSAANLPGNKAEFFLMTTAERVIAIACRMLVKRGNNNIPGSDDNLRDAGLTSLDMVNLMLAIEAEFDVEFPQSAMTPDNFDTVRAIEALVSVTALAA
jgi:acyl carrier protein